MFETILTISSILSIFFSILLFIIKSKIVDQEINSNK